jgi:hypothetical protein
MAIRFYVTEGVLCRERPFACPEAYWPDAGTWAPYPDFNPHTDAREISRTDAADLLPDGHPVSRLDADLASSDKTAAGA